MKKNLQKFLSDVEPLMLLADFLHSVLLSRGRWLPGRVADKMEKSVDKRFDDTFRRLWRSVDYSAKSADRLLRCKVARVALPNGDGVCISIVPVHQRYVKNQNSIIK